MTAMTQAHAKLGHAAFRPLDRSGDARQTTPGQRPVHQCSAGIAWVRLNGWWQRSPCAGGHSFPPGREALEISLGITCQPEHYPGPAVRLDMTVPGTARHEPASSLQQVHPHGVPGNQGLQPQHKWLWLYPVKQRHLSLR